MITVNLLPHHLRPIKHSPLPYFASVGVLFLALVSMLYAFMSIHGRVVEARNDLEARQTELITLADTVKRYNELVDKKQALEPKIAIIKEILSDRVIWSQHLHQLAALTPNNIWYRRIRVTSQNFREQQVKTDPKTGKLIIDPKTQKPQMETKVVPRPVLEISGYVINDEQGERQITPLLENADRSEEFGKDFSLLRPRIEDTEFKGYPVRGFTVEYEIRREGGA